MQDEGPAEGPQARLLRSINRGVERLERLVDESLDYARMQDSNLELDLQPTDLRELYEDTMGIVLPAARAKKQELELNIPEEIPSVVIDRRRCERVLLNLISNANRYTQSGGKISVDVQVESNYLLTSVVDTGQGVGDQVQQNPLAAAGGGGTAGKTKADFAAHRIPRVEDSPDRHQGGHRDVIHAG